MNSATYRLVPIYTSRGDLGAYLVYPYLYSRNGDWIGWVTPDRQVYSVHGLYVGFLTDGPRILRKLSDAFDQPRRACPPRPARIAPLATVPLAPMMSELTFGVLDVLQDDPDLLPTVDFGQGREDFRLIMTDLPGKPVSASRVTLAQVMQPEHANNLGNVHGGVIMKLMDEAGALACMRHAQRRVVTVAVDQMIFRQPIRLGDLVTLTAEVSYVGRTSLETEVHVVAENPITGVCTFTNTGFLVYVALDDDHQPVAVAPLHPETEAELKRMQAGRLRQERRHAQS